MGNVVIVNAKRTPFGNFGGSLMGFTNVQLGAMAVNQTKGELPAEHIDQLIMGNVYPGSGLSPVRQIVCAAGWPIDTNALHVERACCSSMSALGIGYERIRFGRAKIIMIGGMETMSTTPYMLPQLRWGNRLGDFTVYDDLVVRNPYLNAPMAQYAGEVGVEWGEGREQQDEWAVRSNLCAVAAQEKELFKDEIFPVEIPQKKGDPLVLTKDEHPRADSSMEKLAKLNPVYGSPTVTGGNASALSDGASAILLMDESEALERGYKPLARIVDWISVCSEPRNSPLLPSVAARRLLEANNLRLERMSVIEINEAFASMPLVSTRALCDNNLTDAKKLRERVNVKGGAIAIGHPVGASGARVTMTMMYELRRRKEQYGLSAICGAIGQGDAVILEAIY
ncbi:MAG: thiolase family protein [Clostridiales Family XIII bacterium]|jgi:acetyl-CoA C-acetyltransferase|nr:thiolase family protein [Clostridiales Family XIII bacterium]